jgi:ABC-2 type transport system permease protein
MALIISVPLINCVNRLRVEEKRGRLEQVLGLSVNRATLFGGFILIALCEAVVFLFLSALGLYAAGAGTGLVELGPLMASSFVDIPALLVMAGLAALLVGFAPKLTSLIWVVFGYAFIMFYFGRLFNLPEFFQKISPFANIPEIPVQEFTAAPLAVLCVIAVGLFVGGVVGFTRRDSV